MLGNAYGKRDNLKHTRPRHVNVRDCLLPGAEPATPASLPPEVGVRSPSGLPREAAHHGRARDRRVARNRFLPQFLFNRFEIELGLFDEPGSYRARSDAAKAFR